MTQTSQSLGSKIRDAAVQHRFMEPQIEDRAFEAAGRRLIYAADADIFSLYGDPAYDAKKVKSKLGYGQVFQSDKGEEATAIAARLADYIFFNLAPDLPVMIIPPIEYECVNILNALATKVGRNTAPKMKVDNEKLNGLIAKLVKHLKLSKDSIPADIIDSIQKVMFFQEGPPYEFRRLNGLLEKSRIGPPEEVARRLNDPWFTDLVAPSTDIESMIAQAYMQKQWEGLLSEEYNKSQRVLKQRHIERDAEALARLELWNESLEGSPYRIVYITGSRHIFDAAMKRDKQMGSKFVCSFLRHPRAFLADPGVLPTEKSESSEKHIAGLFETFIGALGAPDDLLDGFFLSEKGQEIANKAEKSNDDDAYAIENAWGAYREKLYAAYQPPKSVLKMMEEDLDKSETFKSWQDMRKRLDTKLDQLIAETWDTCFRAATQSAWGLSFLSERQPTRIAPQLCFYDWLKTQEHVHRMSRWHSQKDFDLKYYNECLEVIKEEEKLGYAYYLVHAVLLAGRGSWRIAAIVAQRAISMAKKADPEASPFARGREGSFLRAFCLRHVAQGLDDLKELDNLLDEVEKILKEQKGERKKLKVVSERYKNERLALRMTRWLFTLYSEGTEESQEDPDKMLKTARKLLKDIDSRIKEEESKDYRNDEFKFISDLLNWTRYRVAVNITSLYLHKLSEFQMARDQPGFDEAAEIVCKKPLDQASFFAEGLTLCIEAIMTDNLELRKVKASKAAKHFQLNNSEKYIVFPYDKKRFMDLSNKARALEKTKI